MGNAIKILPHYTYDDFLKWEGKWELIEGLPIAMSPAPLLKHQLIASKLNIEFGIQLKNCRECNIYQPVDYKVSENTVLQPDLLVSCAPPGNSKFIDSTPELVVEILSPSTAYKDRHEKFTIYENQGICYYLLIDPENEIAEVYVLENKKYILAAHGKKLQYSFALHECKADVDFSDIW